MPRVQLLVPVDLTQRVLALLDAVIGLANISLVKHQPGKGSGNSPAGDLVEFDATRDPVDELLDELPDELAAMEPPQRRDVRSRPVAAAGFPPLTDSTTGARCAPPVPSR